MPASYKDGVYIPSTENEKKMEQAFNDLEANITRHEQVIVNGMARSDIQYTMFVSGLRRGRLSEFEGKNNVDDLAILFDSVTQHNYTKSYNKTSYAVESKARSSDHVTTQDGKFTFSAVITDSPYVIDWRNYIDRDTDKENPMEARRPAKAIEIIEAIADSHQLVSLVTEDTILTSYVITNFTVDRTTETGSSVAITLTLEQFRFKSVSRTILARADAKKAKKANSGNKQTATDGAADDNAKSRRATPYLGKNAAGKERIENSFAGTTDFSGKAGSKLPFDPSSLKRP